MGEERLVPKLRFSGFDDEWQSSKFDDLFNFQVAGDMKKELFSEEYSKEYEYPLFANALEDDGLLGYYKEYKYEPNSITVTARGNVGHATVRNSKFNAIGRLIILTAKKDLNVDFFLEYINNNVKVHIESTGVPQLTAPSLKINKLHYPSFNEQNKISDFFNTLNKKLGLLRKKLFEYQKYKKYLMQQIFAQKLRFADFTDDWKIIKLGEITQINTGNKDVKDKIDDGKYPFFVRSEKVERINSYSYDGEAILIPGDGKIGEVYHYINGKFDYHQRVYKISDFKSHVNGKYVYYYLEKNFLRQALRNTAKATVDSLRMDTLTKMPIELPSLKEQIKIADALSIADDKIDLVEKDIKIIKDFKKGLLQQMFVILRIFLLISVRKFVASNTS